MIFFRGFFADRLHDFFVERLRDFFLLKRLHDVTTVTTVTTVS